MAADFRDVCDLPDDESPQRYSLVTLHELATLHAHYGTASGLDEVATAAACDWVAERCSACEPDADLRARAIAVGRAALARHADEFEVVLSVARMYLAVNASAECHVTLLRALQLAPGDPRAMRLLGELLFQRGYWRRAVEAFAYAAARGTADARMWAIHDAICAGLADEPHRQEPTLESSLSDLLKGPSGTDGRDTQVDEDLYEEILWDSGLCDEEITLSR